MSTDVIASTEAAPAVEADGPHRGGEHRGDEHRGGEHRGDEHRGDHRGDGHHGNGYGYGNERDCHYWDGKWHDWCRKY